MTAHTRPTFALRIGITGARKLDDACHVEWLTTQLETMLKAARQTMVHLAETDTDVGSAYQHPPALLPRPVLRFLSPLARGSDRLAATAALAAGFRLHVPMPFPQTEYEKDFDTPEDLAGFHALLARANDGVMALDGDHGPDMNRAYEAVGRYVVRHCDVLIAIWDGGPGAGRGGTADIVRYAASSGVPVWWLHATKAQDPVWIADIQDLRDPLPDRPTAETSLAACITALVRPPGRCHRPRHGLIGHLARLWQSHEVSPETEHFAEYPRKRRWPWRAYSTLMRWTSGLNPPWTAPRQPADAVARYWFDRYEPTDARAGEYAGRYRSTYVWVFVLATAALIFGAAGSMHPANALAVAVMEVLSVGFIASELVALLLIFYVVALCMRRDWHERSIEYRLLAELYRKQQALAPLGWALPITAVRGMAAGDGPLPSRGAWVGWLFAAEQRAAPLPAGDLADAAAGEARHTVLRELITEQLEYHTGRGQMAERAGRFLEGWGERLFAIVLACVGIKMFLVWYMKWHDFGLAFGFLAIILPAVSAAFVGIRAYAELQLLVEESRHMKAELERAQARVIRLDPNRKLASQDLGMEAAFVATLMLQDLQGWARLFRVKSMEIG